MDFTLDKKHEMARQLFRDFAEKEVKPLAIEVDETEEFPRVTVDKMIKAGFMGIPVPKEYGGQGCDPLTYAMCVEELSKVCGTTGVIVSAHTSLCCDPIMTFGTEEQKQKFLVPLAKGEKLGAFGLTEPGAGTDAQGQQTKAVLDGDEWVLNGSKCFITNGKEADVYVIFAVTGVVEKRGRKMKEISAFIVEKGTPGFTFGTKEKKMGIRGSSTYELIFQDCRIPKENLLGQQGKGFNIAMHTLDGGRIGQSFYLVMHFTAKLLRGMDDMLRRYDAGLDGSLCVEIGPVLSCLSVHDGPHMLRFQAEPFPVNRLDLFGKSRYHVRRFPSVIVRQHRVMNHQYGIITHERTLARRPDDGGHRCRDPFDDTFRIHRGIGDGGIGGHAVKDTAALRVDQHTDTGGTDDIFQKVELVIET